MPTDQQLREAKRIAGKQLRVRLARSVDPITAALVQAYAQAWQQTRDELLQAIVDAEAQAMLMGQPARVTIRARRLQAALDELTRSLQQLNAQAGVVVSGAAEAAVVAPGQVLAHLLRVSGHPGATPLNARELASIVQRASSSIASDYRQLSRDAEEALRAALVRGVATGQGPRKVASATVDRARQLAAARYGLTPEQVDDLRRAGLADDLVESVESAFNGGKQRALVLARTELIDASRASTRASYHASGVVVGWRWLSAADSRTCPACWAMHNTIHETDVFQQGHQQCRCTQVPLLDGEELGASDMGDPDQLLRAMLGGGGRDADLLRASFGPGRLDYLAGGGDVRKLATLRTNPGWRPSYVLTPLRDLLAA